MKKKIILGIAALVIVGLIYLAVNPAASKVRTYQVQKGDIQQSVNESGLVQASNYLDIYSGESGKVESLLVEVSSRVKKGDTLLILSNDDLGLQKSAYKNPLIQANSSLSMAKANLERTKIDFAEAKNNYARTEKLYKAGAVSEHQLEEIKTLMNKLNTTLQEQTAAYAQSQEQVQLLEAALQKIEEKIGNLVITSPIDGTVVRLPVKDGQYVTAGSPVAQVASLDRMEIRTEILSDDMADIKVGQKAKITAPILKGGLLAGEVIRIYPQGEEKLSALGVVQYRVPVIISLNKVDILRPGYEVKVGIETLSQQNVITIPREAIVYTETGEQVMLIDKGRITYVKVETGLGDRANIEIKQGLQVGQSLVLDGSSLLKEGTRVKEILTQ